MLHLILKWNRRDRWRQCFQKRLGAVDADQRAELTETPVIKTGVDLFLLRVHQADAVCSLIRDQMTVIQRNARLVGYSPTGGDCVVQFFQ